MLTAAVGEKLRSNRGRWFGFNLFIYGIAEAANHLLIECARMCVKRVLNKNVLEFNIALKTPFIRNN